MAIKSTATPPPNQDILKRHSTASVCVCVRYKYVYMFVRLCVCARVRISYTIIGAQFSHRDLRSQASEQAYKRARACNCCYTGARVPLRARVRVLAQHIYRTGRAGKTQARTFAHPRQRPRVPKCNKYKIHRAKRRPRAAAACTPFKRAQYALE